MIDLHCHILDGMDDGAKTIEDTLEMARIANSLGYTEIFATPHYIDYVFETSKLQVQTKVDYINKLLEDSGISTKLYTGSEIYVSDKILDNLSGMKITCLGNSKYILIEFPMNGRIYNVENYIEQIINQGFIPIIAHPERYEFIQKDYMALAPLLKLGALAQINIASVSRLYGSNAQRTVIALLKHGMVDLIATDAHDSKKVYSLYEKSLAKLKKIVPEDKLYKIMYKNPEQVRDNL